MSFSAADHAFMARALQLAERGLYTTAPNPRVGCVIVRDGRVVGEGWHQRAGEPHAEVLALGQAAGEAAGATAYVSLEPCNHHGRTPPCTEALIQAGIARVVAAARDPNPRVSGGGLGRLAAAGVAVESGLMEAEARELNLGFISRCVRHRPWVRTKLAASLDGKTALANGASKWITGPEARRDAHRWRARSCAVLTGVGTVLADDPRLDVREVETPRQPLRVVVDSNLSIPPGARMLRDGRALIATANCDPEAEEALRRDGVEILRMGWGGTVELPRLMRELAAREINEVTVEAGRTLTGALLEAGLVDEIVLYLAPTLLGERARGMFALPELHDMSGRRDLALRDVRMVGGDLRIVARVPGSAF